MDTSKLVVGRIYEITYNEIRYPGIFMMKINENFLFSIEMYSGDEKTVSIQENAIHFKCFDFEYGEEVHIISPVSRNCNCIICGSLYGKDEFDCLYEVLWEYRSGNKETTLHTLMIKESSLQKGWI
ncbi:MAG: hypothetical protein WC998_00605 [Candidatus Paceibacterota bacterium]|jgi:hypothetical protein